ncbi:alcohol dehydrogenase [Mycobacterium ahvazicum]|uniref:Alcohol dehydrogenase n=1 Tax=Mycobacterium ahvazicum TaxID=1964395 RepID=A0A2K4YH01_9MYCO|nr:zinc-binding dehydrogenase [Mycobacterium ahvazicum]SOX56065.1 alcohol dehydrogenase [Mycobacterium ahvazicum]
MKAWQLTAANEPLRLVELDDPCPGPGEVVIDVAAAGLCHSDVGFLDGTLTPLLPRLPMTLGHEVAGYVSEIGQDVKGFTIGDRVVVGGPEDFAPGWAVDGGFAEKCLTKASGLIKLPDTVAFDQAATATDAGQTAYGAIVAAGEVRPGDRVGIVGLGGLGLTGVQIAKLQGAEVHAAEPKHDVWDIAKTHGVTTVVDDVNELTPLNLDLIVDFAGFGTTTSGAVNAVRIGGRVVQVGLGQLEATISTASLVYKAVTLRGSRGGTDPRHLDAVLAQMASGDLRIPTNLVGFEEIPDAIERLKAGDVIGRFVAVPRTARPNT